EALSDVYRADQGEEHGGEPFRRHLRQRQMKRNRGDGKGGDGGQGGNHRTIIFGQIDWILAKKGNRGTLPKDVTVFNSPHYFGLF
ncbi:MAG: hypothetical protein ACREDT_13155, partial [Methylocella sp.]